MTKGHYIRCNIREFDWILSCRKKATEWCWIEEYDESITIVEVCTMHNKWLRRSDEDEYVDYDNWLVKYAE